MKDNIKMDVIKIVRKGLNWIDVAQNGPSGELL